MLFSIFSIYINLQFRSNSGLRFRFIYTFFCIKTSLKQHRYSLVPQALVFILLYFSQADKLDTMLSTLYSSTLHNTENTAPVLYFSTWLLYYVLRLMIRYILSGFELELFSVHEFPYLYWYLYELLYPWLTTCLHKADSHLIEYEQYLENQTKSQGKLRIFKENQYLKMFILTNLKSR